MFLKQRYNIISVIGVLIGLQVVQPAFAFSHNAGGLPEFVPGKVIPPRSPAIKQDSVAEAPHLHPKPVRKPSMAATQEEPLAVLPNKALAQYFPVEGITILWNNERVLPQEPGIHITAADIPAEGAQDAAPALSADPLSAEDTYDTIVWNGERYLPTDAPPPETEIAAVTEAESASPLDRYVPLEMFPEEQALPVKVALAPEKAPLPQEKTEIDSILRGRISSTMKVAQAPEAVTEEAPQDTDKDKEQAEEVPAAPPVKQPVPETERKAPPPAEEETLSQTQPKEKDAEVRRTFVELAPPESEKGKDTDPHSKIPLKDVIAVALQSNPTIARSLATRELYEASLKDLRGQQEPQVAAFSNLSGEYDTSDESSNRFDDSLSAKAGVRLNYTLYNFGASGDRVEAGGQTVEQAALQFKEAQESLAFDVISTYLEVLRQKELLDIEQFRLTEHEDFLSLIERAAQADQILKSQLYLARTGLSQKKQSYLNVERQLKQTIYALERMTGEKLPIEKFEKPFSPIVVLPEEEEFIEMGLASSPEIQAIEKALNAAQYQHSASQKDKYGSVNVNMNVAGDRNLTADQRKNEAAGSLLLEYSVPLYSGGSNDAKIKQSAAALKQTEADLRLTRDALREQLRLAYYAIQKNDEVLALSKSEQGNAMKTLEAYKGEIAYGGRSFSDVVAQIDSVAAARGREASARMAKTLAAFAIIRRQGSLVDHLKIDGVKAGSVN